MSRYILQISVLGMLMVLIFGTQSYAQQSVSGTVTDAQTNETLPGVNILLQGTATGTSTDAQGSYELTVPSLNDTLVFSFVGYQTQEVPIQGRTTINVELQAQAISGEEVMVVGYGTQQRRDVTGSISSVSSEDIEKLPVKSVEEALQGMAAGVQVTQNSGRPGSGSTVRIRGVGTLGNNDPLYVIDGVQTKEGLNTLNPEDIQSIEILKDASAAAIYGVRGANGVVLITTKKGDRDGELQVSYDSYYGWQSVTDTPELLNAQQWATLQMEALRNANEQRAPGNQLALNPDFDTQQEIEALGQGTDWLDQIFRISPQQNHQLSLSGGGENSQYYVSFNYFDKDGIVRNSWFEKYSLRANTTHQITDNFTVGNNLTINRTKENFLASTDKDDDVISNAVGMPSIVPVRDENGEFAGPPSPQNFYGRSQNPVGQSERTDDKRTNYRILGNVYGEYDILDGLTFKTDIQVDYRTNDQDFFRPTFVEGNRQGPFNFLTRTSNEVEYWTWENTLRYATDIGQDHSFDVLAGVTSQNFFNEIFGASRQSFPFQDPASRYLNSGTQSQSNFGTAQDWSLLSYIGRVNYSFKDRYLLTASIRRDGSSKFADDKRWGNFPSFSLGWRLSDEPFFNVDAVSNLKIRGGWGRLGNEDIGNFYPFLTIYELGGDGAYPFGGTNDGSTPGFNISSRGNAQTTWETTTQTNIGIELGLFEDRISFTGEYFERDTEDILVAVPLPGLGGTSSAPTVNAASVINEGFDFSLGYRQTTGEFSYSIDGNISFVDNEVTSLGQGEPIFGFSGLTRTSEGVPIGSYFGYVHDGIFQNQAEIDQANALDGDASTPYQETRTAPGDFKFKDLNGDGVIDEDDRTEIGSPQPDFSYGLNASFNYRNWDLSMFFQGVRGNELYNFAATGFIRSDLVTSNGYRTMLNRWQGEGTSTDIPRLTADDPNNNNRNSSFYVEDGSYLRFKNVQLGYTFGSELTQSVGIRNLRVYVSAQNLFTITDYSGFDPEIGNNVGGDLSSGIDTNTYPQSRTFLVGLNLNF